MVVSINLNEKEYKLVGSYAKLHSISIDEAFKDALFEKIEDEYDAALADEAYAEYIANGEKSEPIEKLWEECGLS